MCLEPPQFSYFWLPPKGQEISKNKSVWDLYSKHKNNFILSVKFIGGGFVVCLVDESLQNEHTTHEYFSSFSLDTDIQNIWPKGKYMHMCKP